MEWVFVCCYFLLVFILSPESSVQGNTSAPDCLIIPENNYSTLIVKPDQTKCPPYNCWESQLTLSSKAELALEYNNFRNMIAKKKSIKAMMNTLWHWTLEKEAMLILQDCVEERTSAFETRDVSGLDYGMNCEETITKFSMHNGTQRELMDTFQDLLNRDTDPLDNFAADGRFRRTSASHFGCAFMVTKSALYQGYLVCVYCTNQKSISDELLNCPNKTELGNSIKFPNLCAHDPHALLSHLYGCFEFNSSLESVCAGEKPEIWKQQPPGPSRAIYLIFNKNGLLYFIDDPNLPSAVEETLIVVTCEDVGRCPPSVPAWYYVYNRKKIQLLNHSVYYGSAGGQFIRYPPFNVVFKVDQSDRIEYLKAQCCIYLFVLFLLMFFLALGVAYYTYKHLMKKIK